MWNSSNELWCKDEFSQHFVSLAEDCFLGESLLRLQKNVILTPTLYPIPMKDTDDDVIKKRGGRYITSK